MKNEIDQMTPPSLSIHPPIYSQTYQERRKVETARDGEELRPLVKRKGLPGQEAVLAVELSFLLIAVVVGQLCFVWWRMGGGIGLC